MATVNGFVTNILQNILFCIQQKKEVIQVSNNMGVSKCYFWVNCSFKMEGVWLHPGNSRNMGTPHGEKASSFFARR